ncbi:FAD:protein FMN transferase [Psittacicella hinzii]|uniref:FAD:protein FMN transferase n=1 Tax=Psittacicella hinzii TaxID=2028575 RepID=A0A3A1YU94_9GAMM|nr:FAD:protein FMN transferase [Psittacicella hinzii]RIY40004.1 hypothetical protein CKF58_01175 [Psittacicella hinzii]
MSTKKRLIWVIIFFIIALILKQTFFPNKNEDTAAAALNNQKAAATTAANTDDIKTPAVQISGNVFGTSYHITFLPSEMDQKPEQIQAGLIEFFKQFNSEFSTYDPKSVISQFNDFDKANVEFPVSRNFATVIAKAREIWEMTEGYEDVTVYSLVKAWGFGPGKANDSLTDEQVKELLTHVGMDKLALIEHQDGTFALVKSDGKLQIDLSSIAKGYAVDLAAQYLAEHGGKNYLVEIGGEIVAKGVNPSNRPWQVAIDQPREDGANSVNTIIGIENKALATSGHYRNFRYVNGKRITHEIDPFTGHSVTHDTVSLTVIANDCMTADGLSTGLYVMGADKALEIAEKYNLAIFTIQFKDGKFVMRQSSAFSKAVLTEAELNAKK